MVAWESNPTMGALIADLGPYIGSDWPPEHPALEGRLPIEAGEVDYYVLDPAQDDYLTIGFSPSGTAWSDSYIYEHGAPGDTDYRSGAYTDGSSSGPVSGSHIYVAWYDYDYNTVPAAPPVSPETLIPPSYSSLGTLTPLTYHFGPWITPDLDSFTFSPASGISGEYGYTPSAVSIADVIAHPGSESYSTGRAVWLRDQPGPNEFLYQVGTNDISTGLTQYAQDPGHSGPGFRNATPGLPTGAVEVEQEVLWDHTYYAEMLASIVGDIHIDLNITFPEPTGMVGDGFRRTIFWIEPPSGLENEDTTFGRVARTAGSPTQTDLEAALAAPIAEFTFIPGPMTGTTQAVHFDVPLSDFYTGMLPYRDDLSPSVRINFAIQDGIDGYDPAAPGVGETDGFMVQTAGAAITITYQPPRYRFKYYGPGESLIVPPLRQLQRDDGLAGGARSQIRATSRQASLRQSPRGTYL